MKWRIPGTVLQIERENADGVEEVFSSMFLAGGIVLSQVSNITGLEPYTVQNWVKRGFLSPPQRKRYNMNQVCRILNINMLRTVLPMETICGMLSYINGHLDDTSDDTIRDSDLYFIFVQLASSVGQQVQHPDHLDDWIADALEDYPESIPGAKARIQQVLKIMLTAWAAAQLRAHAENMVDEILYNKENAL